MATCITCANYEYLSYWDEHFCNAQQHGIREDLVDCDEDCDFYKEKE